MTSERTTTTGPQKKPPGTDTRTPVEIIDRAIELLERDGWRQHDSGPSSADVSAPRCLRGALFAAEPHPYVTRELLATLGFICKVTGTALLPTWNDAPERTYDEVLDALRKARELAAQEERP